MDRIDHRVMTQSVRLEDMVKCAADENPNVMAAETFDALVAALKGGDFNQPVLLSRRPDGATYDIVDGNHRHDAAAAAGLDSLPAIVRDYTPDQVRAYRLGMNRLRGEVDLARAAAVIQDLVAEGWGPDEMVVTGFTEEELAEFARMRGPPDDELLAQAGTATVEDAPAVAAKAFVLEIAFADKAQYQLAKRRLKKAAGGTKDLALGLLNVLGEEG